MESVSENLLMNISIKNRTAAENKTHDMSNSCCLRDSLQLQHSTNLNIQRSQSTHRFTGTGSDTNRDPTVLSNSNYEEPLFDELNNDESQSMVAPVCENSDSNYLEETPDVQEEELDGEDEGNVAAAAKEANNRANLALPVASRSDVGSLTTNLAGLSVDNTVFTVIPNPVSNKPCDYLKLVVGFKRTLMLPDVFFTSDSPQCFCGCSGTVNGSLKSKLKVILWLIHNNTNVFSHF